MNQILFFVTKVIVILQLQRNKNAQKHYNISFYCATIFCSAARMAVILLQYHG